MMKNHFTELEEATFFSSGFYRLLSIFILGGEREKNSLADNSAATVAGVGHARADTKLRRTDP